MSALEDRRQRAREAAYDAVSRSDPYYQTKAAIEAAIKTATQVKITEDIVETMYQATGCTMWPHACQALLKLALEAAGFEVVE